MNTLCRNLVVVEDERVGNDDILAAGGVEDDDFGNVIGGKRLDTAAEVTMVSILFLL